MTTSPTPWNPVKELKVFFYANEPTTTVLELVESGEGIERTPPRFPSGPASNSVESGEGIESSTIVRRRKLQVFGVESGEGIESQ